MKKTCLRSDYFRVQLCLRFFNFLNVFRISRAKRMYQPILTSYSTYQLDNISDRLTYFPKESVNQRRDGKKNQYLLRYTSKLKGKFFGFRSLPTLIKIAVCLVVGSITTTYVVQVQLVCECTKSDEIIIYYYCIFTMFIKSTSNTTFVNGKINEKTSFSIY